MRNPRKYGRLRTAAISVTPSPGLRVGEPSTHLAIHDLHAEPQREGDEDRREHQARGAGPFPLGMFVLQLPLTPPFGVGISGICGKWSAHLAGQRRRRVQSNAIHYTDNPGTVVFNCEHHPQNPPGYAPALCNSSESR